MEGTASAVLADTSKDPKHLHKAGRYSRALSFLHPHEGQVYLLDISPGAGKPPLGMDLLPGVHRVEKHLELVHLSFF